ncbi:MAG: TraR/DksA family transcriptional regulator [Desulfomicrobium sp.]|nr:TraR/DksA family transcriptional regulator [Pseudomonadota bacterium]MBV1712350.1 TraR/DksA family transcriptional regulator [Desulfomicrobium sp.]MBU4572510.1 TraR/DksA family transcriptional regulator [Pseudomonadota bacterium]MBU4595156.1 TraR/DksA family transcriptional regulator [Pseudomonadota bacterium]MBV1719635.1 TraR/DksA family transcriptional regulator [Desulfomicrobium sp.]
MSSFCHIHRGIEIQLREKFRKIEEENDILREHLSQNRPLEPDLADQAATASSRDWNVIRYNRNVKLLKDITVALKAIDNDSYGICEMCGEHIADRRLLAIPSALFCIECQETIDKLPCEFGRTGLGNGILAAV